MSNIETSQIQSFVSSRLDLIRENNKARIAVLGSFLAIAGLALNGCGNTNDNNVSRSYLLQDTQTTGNPVEDLTSETP